ncbi:hypothetical protein HGP28_08945 [Vibrio sp. SM6]|uniref:Uncharacterized protein n=1 Tax=Vibrio agarilyticus TaxID=2726741 RepID=A0A7X8YGI9_9VIBR|nr:hypothetical protein [Vibrio agarilyticus]NLS13013.1 hypothetical protein [Vibrio agarilyticus]
MNYKDLKTFPELIELHMTAKSFEELAYLKCEKELTQKEIDRLTNEADRLLRETDDFYMSNAQVCIRQARIKYYLNRAKYLITGE